MEMVELGARRLPDRRRRRVVLPAPLAGFYMGGEVRLVDLVLGWCFWWEGVGEKRGGGSPPMRRVRLPGGNERDTSFRPEEPSGKA
jgi:hypothetical protein